ncbi:MAG TPA: dihydropyrimidinase [Chloroflexota bacterium]|nr:dihydropyrimidinase [Chloroflexota bacterium]
MSVEQVDTIVRGGRVVLSSGVVEAAIAVNGGKIVAVASESVLPPAANYIDASGQLVLPGLVDTHTHIYLDSYRSISESAACGGVTSLLSYIWPDQAQDIPGSIDHWRRFGEAASVVDFGLHICLQDSPASLEQLPAAMEAGVTSLKLMMGFKRRGMMVSDEFMMAAMEAVGRAGGIASVHCESGGVINYLEEKMVAAGLISPVDFPRSRPAQSEVEAIQRAISIAEMAGCPLYIAQITTADSVDVVADARLSGRQVWAETCPHYLFMTEAEYEHQGPLVKIAPPLRTEADCEALWTGIDRGIISVVTSDHTGYSREMKQGGWANIFQVPFGFPGSETMLPLMYTEGVVKRDLPITTLVKLLSENPAKLFGLFPRKGAIQVGADADLVVFDPEAEITITSSALHTQADFTPFEGRKVKGQVTNTMLRGDLVVKDGQIVELPPHGEFLVRQPNTLTAV